MIKNLTISKLNKEDLPTFENVVSLLAEVFERENFSMPDSKHLKKVLGKKDFMVFTAHSDTQVIGAITAYTLDQYYSKKPLAYIYDLAVHTNYQRQGVGKKLVEALNNYCKSKDYEEAYVQADKEDDHALDFYRALNASREDEVVHFSFTLNS